MKLSHKNIFKGWKTSLIGVIMIGMSGLYLYTKDDPSDTIAFGLIGIGIAFWFFPDAFLKAFKRFIIKNQEKEL